MESRTVLAFRIFVMLSCLIIVPMAAIFGSAFPDVVKGLLVDRIVYWATGKAPEPNREANQDGLGTVKPAAQQGTYPGVRRQTDAPRWDNPSEATSWQMEPSGSQSSAVLPAAASGPGPPAGNSQAVYVEAAPPSNHAAVGSVYSSGPAGAAAPVQGAVSSASAGDRPPAEGSRAQPDPFTAMERKLREYGATYYLLETWGNDSQSFRFHCKMAIGNNPNYTRHFEATDHDALRAMQRVLERVEAWRAGRPH